MNHNTIYMNNSPSFIFTCNCIITEAAQINAQWDCLLLFVFVIRRTDSVYFFASAVLGSLERGRGGQGRGWRKKDKKSRTWTIEPEIGLWQKPWGTAAKGKSRCFIAKETIRINQLHSDRRGVAKTYTFLISYIFIQDLETGVIFSRFFKNENDERTSSIEQSVYIGPLPASPFDWHLPYLRARLLKKLL